jgi:hypothetical protein
MPRLRWSHQRHARGGGPHAPTYDVIAADGHVFEPIDICDEYIEPKLRERAPEMIADGPQLSPETKRQIPAGGAMGFYKLNR